MTSEDALKFCDKGNHKYVEVDVLRSVRDEGECFYLLMQCSECPSKWVKKF